MKLFGKQMALRNLQGTIDSLEDDADITKEAGLDELLSLLKQERDAVWALEDDASFVKKRMEIVNSLNYFSFRRKLEAKALETLYFRKGLLPEKNQETPV